MDERQKEYEDMAVSILPDEYTGLDVDQLLKEYDEAEKNGELPPIPEEPDRRCQDLVRSQRGEFTNEALTKLLLDIYADMDVDEFIREYEELDDAGELPDIPEEDYRQFLKHAKGNVLKKCIRKAVKVLSSVAAVALMLVGLATVLVMSVDAWRLPVVKFVVEKFDRYSVVIVKDRIDETNNPKRFTQILSQYISEDYVCIENVVNDDGSVLIRYKTNSGQNILFRTLSSHLEKYLDTENNYSRIEFDGIDVIFIAQNGYRAVWTDESSEIVCDLRSNGLSEEYFWKIVLHLMNR